MQKGARLLISVFIIVLLAFSWLIALSQKSDKEKQAELIDQAQSYLDDEVYILAAPVLEEAVSYNTSRTEEAETMLKSVYLQLLDQTGYATKYTDLLDEEMAREDASEEVFSEAASYYIDTSDLQTALEVLCDGIEKTGSETLEEMYEENRYGYSIGYDTYDDVTEIYNGALCVKDDGLWGLASEDGDLQIACAYEKVSNAMSDRAVVSDGNEIYAVDFNGNRLALLHESASEFGYVGEGVVMVRLEDGWHMANGSFTTVLDTAYEEIGMMSDDYAAAKKDGKWGLVDTSGEWLLNPEYDGIVMDELGRSYAQEAVFVKDGDGVKLLVQGKNGFEQVGDVYEDAKPFADAYAAVKMDGKWGFVNTDGELVIECQYDDARSFGQHLAAVEQDGQWGYISLDGTMVIPCSFDDAKSFCDGRAPVKTERGWKIITLDEYKGD